MKRLLLLGAIAGIVISGAFPVHAQTSNDTIESCSTLLPSGHNFKLHIYSEIDTTSKPPKVKGKFSLSDGTDKEEGTMNEKVQPYVDCVTRLMK